MAMKCPVMATRARGRMGACNGPNLMLRRLGFVYKYQCKSEYHFET
jgi:hypothetical protein